MCVLVSGDEQHSVPISTPFTAWYAGAHAMRCSQQQYHTYGRLRRCAGFYRCSLLARMSVCQRKTTWMRQGIRVLVTTFFFFFCIARDWFELILFFPLLRYSIIFCPFLELVYLLSYPRFPTFVVTHDSGLFHCLLLLALLLLSVTLFLHGQSHEGIFSCCCL